MAIDSLEEESSAINGIETEEAPVDPAALQLLDEIAAGLRTDLSRLESLGGNERSTLAAELRQRRNDFTALLNNTHGKNADDVTTYDGLYSDLSDAVDVSSHFQGNARGFPKSGRTNLRQTEAGRFIPNRG